MKIKYQNLKIRQLDDRLKSKALKELEIPLRGWIWEIRNALGMSHLNLAKRLNVTAPAIVGYENNEVKKRISLNTLERIAKAMKCKFVYCIVPETSLENILEEQKLKVAGKIFSRVNHSMNLEEQGLSNKEKRRKLNELIDEVYREKEGKIWDYEV